MSERPDQIQGNNILESLKIKEDEFEKAMAEAKEKAATCIKNAQEKARLLEKGLEDELKTIREEMMKEEKIKTEKIIESINADNQRAIDILKKQFALKREAAIEFVLNAVMPKTTDKG
jgi:vacuolar-type H+-ATPase subunit H